MAYPDPVFVGGAGGSGAPAVGALVGAHSRYALVPVPARFHSSPAGLPGFLRGAVSVDDFVDRVRTAWFHTTDESGRATGLARVTSEDSLEAALADFERHARQEPLRAARRLVRALLDPVAELERKASWVDFTASNAFTARALARLFPEMRVIHCVRDGRDIAADIARLDGKLDFDAALAWWASRVREIQAELSRLPPDRTLLFRIEDLAGSHREAAFRALLQFLILDDEAAMRERLELEAAAASSEAGRWREGLSTGEAVAVTSRYEELLSELEHAGVWWAPRLADGASDEALATARPSAAGRPETNGVPRVTWSDEYDGVVPLPYTVDEVEGATHMLVTFSGLSLEAREPPVEMRKRLGKLRAHRMFIGADRNGYFGPETAMPGARSAIRLIKREAERLGVEERNVITYGVSAASLAALYVGLKVRAGQIFAGAPPIRIAGWLLRLDRSVAPSADAARMRQELLERTGVARDSEIALFYDRVIWRAAQRATHDATIHLFASPNDPVIAEAEWFHEVLRDHPTLTCRVEIQDYGDHSWAKLPFFGYMQKTLLPQLGSYS